MFQIDALWQGPFPSRLTEVGVEIDLAGHELDVICNLHNLSIVRVYAGTARRIYSANCQSIG